MGFIALLVLVAVELFFMTWSIVSKKIHAQEKSIVRISEFLLLAVLLATGVFQFGFRFMAIAGVLLIQAILAIAALKRKTEKPYKLSSVIVLFFLVCLLYTGALMLAIICPQYTTPAISGEYDVASAKYTWTDESRVERFSDTGENRSLTVEFWYPENAGEACPLVVFSHGAFGFSGSNYSTFAELASNGYVVASIGHSYQAFYTLDTAGKFTLVNTDFLNTAMAVQNNEIEDAYPITQAWMELRTADENFVLDTIIRQTKENTADALFSLIDTEKIGLFGHSMGGASSAQIGRDRDDIDAVIVLDGTMLGEVLDHVDGVDVLNTTAYPVPLLNIYAEDHYANAMATDGEAYANFYASKNALNANELVIKRAGHLNFTDLPLFSPVLARALGVGTVDARYCIETTNQLVLEYFNCYLKGKAVPQFEKEY